MRLYKTTFISLISIIAITNLQIVKEYTGINRGYYAYSNLEGTFTTSETLRHGNVFTESQLKNPNLERFREEFPNTNDTVIYRLFKINPLKFWRWSEYIFNWRYDLPYANWNEIVKRRGYQSPPKSNIHQHF